MESGTPQGPGFFMFFQQETGANSPQGYTERYREEYDGGILSRIFTQHVTPKVTEEDPIIEIRVPEEATEKHLKRYVESHGLDKYMSAMIIKEIVKRPDMVLRVQKEHGIKRDDAREVLFDALMEDLEFKIEKDEEDIALLMIIIEMI